MHQMPDETLSGPSSCRRRNCRRTPGRHARMAGWLIATIMAATTSAFAAAPDISLNLPGKYGMVNDDGTAELFVRLFSWEHIGQEYELRHWLAERDGTKLADFAPLKFRFEGEWRTAVSIALPRFGSFTYAAKLHDAAGQEVAAAERIVTWVVSMPERTADQRQHSFIGINSHQWADWQLFARLGIYWVRDYVWQWYARGEHGTSTPQGENFIRRLEAAHAAGINTLPCIQKSFTTNDKRRWLEDGDEIAAIFTRISGHFPGQPLFQIGNEEESAFPGHVHDVANYANFIIHAARGMAAAGHGAQVVLAGDVFMHDEMMAGLLATPARDAFATSCIHVYTGTVPPEIATRDTNVGGEDRRADAYVLDRIREYAAMLTAANRQTWMTETGWDVTYGPAVGERLQAVYLPRMYLLNRWAGIEKTFWFFDLDGKGQQRFSSSGLVDLAGNLRPSGAAIAALSRLALGAEPAGSLDLGDDDLWALVWKMPDDSWLVTAWAVKRTHPLPPLLATAARAYDLFANELAPDAGHLDDQVRYCFFPELPPAFAAQRRIELASRRLMSANVGGGCAVAINVPTEAQPAFRFADLPPDMTATPWQIIDGKAIATIAVANDAAPGRRRLTIQADGDGWQRRWPVNVEIQPALAIHAEPYLAGKPLALELQRLDGKAMAGTAALPEGAGTLVPAQFATDAGTDAKLKLEIAAGTTGAIPLTVALDDGIRQSLILRPLALTVPRLDAAADDTATSWPPTTRIAASCFATTRDEFMVTADLAWSPEGLHLTVLVPAEEVFPGDPDWFWNYQGCELFLRTGEDAGDRWDAACRQFWFCPVREDGEWRLQAGEWRKRFDAKADNIRDDQRIRTTMVQRDGLLLMTAFIPTEALGAVPAAGQRWRAAIAAQAGRPAQMDLRAAWPRLKHQGLLERPASWGMLDFQP